MTEDQQLLRRFTRQESPEALDEAVRRYRDLVYSSALRQTRDSHLAEDVTQAVFLVLWQKAGQIRDGVALGGWLLAVTRRAALHAMKKQDSQHRHERQAAKVESRDSPTIEEWNLIAPEIDAALSELSGKDRDAVVLRFLQNKSFAQVGVELGISEEAARKRVTRALDRLRARLNRKGHSLEVIALGLLLGGHGVKAAPTAPAAASLAAVTLAKAVIKMMALARIQLVSALAACLLLVAGTVVFLYGSARRPMNVAVVRATQPAPNPLPAPARAPVLQSPVFQAPAAGGPVVNRITVDPLNPNGSPAAAPTVQIVASRPAGVATRPDRAIDADLIPVYQRMNNAIMDPAVFTTPQLRQAAAPQTLGAIDEIVKMEEQRVNPFGFQDVFVLLKIVKLALDDPATIQENQRAIAAGGDGAALAAVMQAAARYLQVGQNADAQMQAIDEVQRTMNRLPAGAPVTFLPNVFAKNPPVTDAVADHLVEFLKADTHSVMSPISARSWASPETRARVKTQRAILISAPFEM
jgi:RNA polymerase sigma factor (sigma-70 family)